MPFSAPCSALASPFSTERMVPIGASSFSAISRLVRSSLRDLTSEVSSSSASRERSAPSAWIRVASSSSSRSASRRRSAALSSASSADISRRVADSMSAKGASEAAEPLTGRSFILDDADFVVDLKLHRQQPRIRRFGKRLGKEAYVAECGRATSRQSYALQSNQFGAEGVGHAEPALLSHLRRRKRQFPPRCARNQAPHF